MMLSASYSLMSQYSAFLRTLRLLTVCACMQVRAMRLSFVGELGWELHIPKASCLPVYQAVMAAGAKYGVQNAAYRAIDSLSIEKGEVLFTFHMRGQ